MDLRAEWNKLNITEENLDSDTIQHAFKRKSKLAIATLVQGLRVKSYWVLGFTVLFVIFTYLSLSSPTELVINSVFLVMSVFLYARLRQFLREQKEMPIADIPPVQWVDIQANSIKEVLIQESTLVNFVYLFMGGFYIVLQPLLEGESLLIQFQEPKFWIKSVLVITVILLAKKGGEKMSQYAFGQHLEALEEYKQSLAQDKPTEG